MCSVAFDYHSVYRVGVPARAPRVPPPQDMFKLVHYEVRTVGKQAVGIRLKCLLVVLINRTSSTVS